MHKLNKSLPITIPIKSSKLKIPVNLKDCNAVIISSVKYDMDIVNVIKEKIIIYNTELSDKTLLIYIIAIMECIDKHYIIMRIQSNLFSSCQKLEILMEVLYIFIKMSSMTIDNKFRFKFMCDNLVPNISKSICEASKGIL
jgi:hypothetical protein